MVVRGYAYHLCGVDMHSIKLAFVVRQRFGDGQSWSLTMQVLCLLGYLSPVLIFQMNSESNTHVKSQESCIRSGGVFVSKYFMGICASLPSHTNNGKASDSHLPIPLLCSRKCHIFLRRPEGWEIAWFAFCHTEKAFLLRKKVTAGWKGAWRIKEHLPAFVWWDLQGIIQSLLLLMASPLWTLMHAGLTPRIFLTSEEEI